jgi:hypothetical protein
METAIKPHPHHIRARLTRDVGSILSVCIEHFEDEEQRAREECFNVDAVIEGRSMRAESITERKIVPAAYTRSARPQVENPAQVTVPKKGYFIPRSYTSTLSFA